MCIDEYQHVPALLDPIKTEPDRDLLTRVRQRRALPRLVAEFAARTDQLPLLPDAGRIVVLPVDRLWTS